MIFHFINYFRNYLAVTALWLIFALASSAQTVNDFGAVTSGSWTSTTTWRQWDGTGWNTIPTSFPNSTSANVWILSGSIVTLPPTGPFQVASLRVESLAKLYTNNTTVNTYVSVWGSTIVCDGEIGNGNAFDGIGFNIEGTSCTISGNGVFYASRIRKSASTNPITGLIMDMDVSLLWSTSSSTAIYNNVQSAGVNTQFNVTVNANCTFTVGTLSFPANVSIDGVAGSGGVGSYDAGGTFTINGTMIITGVLYATTDNTAVSYGATFVIGTGGTIKTNQINSPNSGTSGMFFDVRSDGKLELTGPNAFCIDSFTWGTINNRYSFLPGSTVEYSSTSDQFVLQQSDFNSITGNHSYWNLVISGSGNKIIRPGLLSIRGSLDIINSSGAPSLDQSSNNTNIFIGGNWVNYDQIGFMESVSSSCYVKFNGDGSSPNVPTQTISCPGGEVFTNLWIAKNTGGIASSVKLLHPVSVNLVLTLGEAGFSYYGILDLNKNSLTLESPSAAAITLTGSGRYNRFIICEDSTGANGSIVRWNIGATSTPIPNIFAIVAGTQNFWPWPYVIPFGVNSITDTIPFGFYKASSADMGYLSVATYGTPPDNLPWPSGPNSPVTNLNAFITANNTPDNRDWTVDRFYYVGATNAVAGCGVAFLYDANVNPGSTRNEYPLRERNPWNISSQYWDAANSTWKLPQIGIGVGPITFPFAVNIPSAVIDTGFPVFNTHWALSSNASPLPIELLQFDVHSKGDRVELNWITSSEINNDYFLVERSKDGSTFSSIGSLEGAGNSSTDLYYFYTDPFPLPGISYYRLRQIDYDGLYSHSTVRMVDRNTNENSGFTLSPNPASGTTVLSASSDISEEFMVTLFDIQGRKLFSSRFEPSQKASLPLNLEGMPTGVYHLHIVGESSASHVLLVKE